MKLYIGIDLLLVLLSSYPVFRLTVFFWTGRQRRNPIMGALAYFFLVFGIGAIIIGGAIDVFLLLGMRSEAFVAFAARAILVRLILMVALWWLWYAVFVKNGKGNA